MILGSVIGTSLESVISNIFDSIDGDSFPFATGARIPIYCYGDSNMANAGRTYDENNRGLPTMLEFYSNGRIQFLTANNYGYGGDTSYDLKEYVTGGTPNNEPELHPAIVIPTNALVLVGIGTNDLGSAAITFEEFVSNMQTIIAVFKGQGNFILIENIKPRNALTTDTRAQLLQMREWITITCAEDSSLYEIDGSIAIAEADWAISSGYSLDGLHLNNAGRVAQVQQAWYNEGVEAFIGTNTFPTANYDIANDNFSTSGGTNSATSFSGFVPTGWRVVDYAKDTSNADIMKQCEWAGEWDGTDYGLTAALAPSADSDGHEYLYFFQDVTGWSVGETIRLQSKFKVLEATNAYFAGARMQATGGASTTYEAMGAYGSNSFIDSDFIGVHQDYGLAETQDMIIPEGTTNIRIQFTIGVLRRTGLASSISVALNTMQVSRIPLTLAISGTPTADCEAGTPYTGFTPAVVGGTQPYMFSIAAGELPEGLSLNTSTGAITGTPTVEGMYEDIVLRVTDYFGLTDDLPAFDMEIQAASGVLFQRQLVQLDIASGATAPASAATLSPTFDMAYSLPVSYGAKLAVTTTSYSMRDFYTQAVMATSSLNTSRSTATVGTQICEIYFAGVQLPSSMVDSVQIITGQLTTTQGAGADVEFSIPTAVTKSRSVTFVQPYAHIKGASTNMQNNDVAVDIKSDGTKLLVRRSSLIASATVDFSVAVIQFKAGVINNKQDGMITIGTSQATNTATITSVTTSNTILFPRGVLQGGVANSAAYYACAYPYLTNSTTVTAKRDATGTTGSTTLDVYFTALELVSGHVSVQHKEIVMTGASSATVAITSSADATSFLLLNGSSCSATASSEERITAKIAKDSSTQLSATRIISTNNCTVAVQDIQVL